MREIASFEFVSDAAEALLLEGVEPSIVNVQKRIGGGSYSTVKKHLAAWAEKRAKDAAAASSVPAEVLAKAQEFGRTLWGLASMEAQREIQKAKEDAQVELAAVRSELAEATGVIARLENVEAEQAATLESSQARLREVELALVEAQTKALRVPVLENALADARAATENLRAELTQKAAEAGRFNGEVETLRTQVRELMAALKK
ncbi:DNA-binding protein [Ferribacterium limneticum]|uniref:DNA-binding protein n=1 Tax=Ferribacterium limneticum TaxID=76259 RepID=UPI001CF90FF6|nr:DNA-binding protein [Ferribacterium limneticum]UCV22316.1 DNA-binding protein [Ferribacterium limneticum]